MCATCLTAGELPIHLAARHYSDSYVPIVILLIQTGSKLLAKDNLGRTPLDVSTRAHDCASVVLSHLLHSAQLAINSDVRRLLTGHIARIQAHEFTNFERTIYRERMVRGACGWPRPSHCAHAIPNTTVTPQMEQRLCLCSYQQMWKLMTLTTLADTKERAKKIQAQERSRLRVRRGRTGGAPGTGAEEQKGADTSERHAVVLSKQGVLSLAVKREAFLELERNNWLTVRGLASLQLQQERERERRRKFIAFDADRCARGGHLRCVRCSNCGDCRAQEPLPALKLADARGPRADDQFKDGGRVQRR